MMNHLMRVFMKSLLCGILPFSLLFGGLSVFAYTGNAPQAKTADANLRVMSYNVLVDNDESLGGWSWGQPLGNRGDKASACINYYKPDVIGLQECNYKWHVSLRQNLPDYDFVNPDVPEQQALEKTESLGKKDWMCTTLMYNTKTLTLLDNELIGYSVNYWGCIQRMRYVSMALFEIKASGQKFVLISTHFDAEKDNKGKANRVTQAGELADCINRYKGAYGCPVISTGDYNSGYSDDPIQTVVSKAGMTSSKDNRGGIDYILFSKGVESKYFTVISDGDVAGASDHSPIIADLAVSGNPFPTTKATTTTTTASKPAYITTSSTTRGSVVINKQESTTTTGWEDVTVTVPDGETTSAEAETTTAGEDTAPTENKAEQKEETAEKKKDTAASKTQPPVWLLALAGFGGTLAVAGLGFLTYWLIARRK